MTDFIITETRVEPFFEPGISKMRLTLQEIVKVSERRWSVFPVKVSIECEATPDGYRAAQDALQRHAVFEVSIKEKGAGNSELMLSGGGK